MDRTDGRNDEVCEADEGLDERLLGKDEMNLAEFPITLLSERKNVSMISREITTRDERTGLAMVRRVTVTGSSQYGLPTAQDNLVLLALIYLTKRTNNFSDRRVWFTRSELITILGWPDSGQSYQRIRLSLKRWANVFILYENAWWEKPKQTYSTKGFGIVDDFELIEGLPPRQLALIKSNIAWNEVFFQSLEAGFVRTLDLKILLRLRHPTSQQMYRFLGKHFYRSPSLTLDLRTFACEHVGLDRGYEDNGKLKEKLQPAIEELEAIGFLEPMARQERYTKVGRKHWTITLRRQAELGLEAVDGMEPEFAPLLGPEPTPHERELIERGVTPATAAELVVGYPAERIQQKLEAYDWLAAKRDRRVSRSPAGYLAESIRRDYALPRGFEPQAERERRLAAEQQQRRRVDEARRQAEAEQRAREQVEQARIRAYWEALSAGDRQALQTEALTAPTLGFMVRQYRRAVPDSAHAKRLLQMILDTHILTRLGPGHPGE